jgi:hypothetical protein
MLAGFIADVVRRDRDAAEDVARARLRFPTMRYCLAPERALPMLAEVLAAILPAGDYADRFATALTAAGRVARG